MAVEGDAEHRVEAVVHGGSSQLRQRRIEADLRHAGFRRAFGVAGDAAESCLNSFTGDTPVTMADGSKKPIDQIKVGDKVLATDPRPA